MTDPTPWVSRLNPNDRREEPDAFPEAILTWGVDYRPRTEEEAPASESYREMRAVIVCPRSAVGTHLFVKGKPTCHCGITRERVKRGGWGTWDLEARSWVEEQA